MTATTSTRRPKRLSHQSDTIVLRRSRPLEISTDGGGSEQIWTTASTVQEALAQLQMTDKAPLAASRGSRVPLGGHGASGGQPQTVQIDDGGVIRTVRLAAPNVAGLLDAAGVPLQQSDTVVPAPASPVVDGMQIQVTRIRIEKVTQRVPLAPNNQRIEDVTLNMSRQIVEDPGSPGVQDVTFAVATVNGVETGQVASSQCRDRSGARWCASSRRQTGHRGACGRQRRHLGCALTVRSRR